MDQQWYYSQDGAQYGPVDEAEIIRLIQERELPPFVPVFREGGDGWMPAREHNCFQVEIYPRKRSPIPAAASAVPKVSAPAPLQTTPPLQADPPVVAGYAMPGHPMQTNIVFREDDVAVVFQPGCLDWPDRCVHCNEPAQGYRVNRTLSWNPWWVLLTFFCSVLVLLIVAMVTRKSVKVAYGLCLKHKKQRHIGIAVSWVGLIGGLILLFAFMDVNETVGAFGCGGGLVAIIVGLFMIRSLRAKKIDDHCAYIKVGRPFLESLPRR